MKRWGKQPYPANPPPPDPFRKCPGGSAFSEIIIALFAKILTTSCCGYDDKGPPWPQG